MSYFEEGLYIDIFKKFQHDFQEFLRKQSIVYDNLDDFISAYTKMDNVELNYFQNLFIYLLIVEIVIFLIFIIHRLVDLILNCYK